MKKSGFLFIVVALAAIALIGFHAEAFGATYDCSSSCQVCHTAESGTMRHPGGTGTPVMCMECHQQNRTMCSDAVGGPVHSGAEIDIVAIACRGCHGPNTCGMQTPIDVLLGAAATIHASINASPVLPVGAGTPVCGGSISGTTGDTSTSFVISDASTINGGLAGANTVHIDWGDGSGMEIINAGADSAPHTFANPGTYRVRKTVQDSFGFNCYTEYTVTISNIAPGGFDTFTLTALTCNTYACTTATTTTCDEDADCPTGDTCNLTTPVTTGGTNLGANVNAYLVAGNLSFHGVTNASGVAVMPTIANTMPTGNYSMTAFAPLGQVCYTNQTCLPASLVNNPSTAKTVPGSDTVYCK